MTITANQQITFLYTTDLEASSAFYREVMELPFALDQGCCHIYRLSPSSFLGVCDIADRPKSPVGVTVSLVVSDVDAWCTRLKDKSVVFEREPGYSEKFKVYGALFLDPNGYRIEIQQFRDPDWKE
ncbi:VOC family protein [Pelagibius sp. Alg239-R121]|uniref:VOC family protein n=1 Tax=Pelagibius sp. Alg239-R121 TaxID=2993448 RepID=UPI0024A63B05|nr:VOC family protein [Pelagibius sp. Alg239-R121]